SNISPIFGCRSGAGSVSGNKFCSETEYIAYVSEQNLLPDTDPAPLRHPKIGEMFEPTAEGRTLRPKFMQPN
ncbi:MAG: hemimethylated DNA-binding YccV-like domain-containing protein, partial [Pseudomonadota bacterium]